jgi:transposase-like protein
MKNPKCPKCNSSKDVILQPSSLLSVQGIQPSSLAMASGSLFSFILSKKKRNNDRPHSQFKCNNCKEDFNQ